MSYQLNTSFNKDSYKDKYFKAEKDRFYHHLLNNTATASMASEALEIPQKNITRYKRELEDNGLLWEVEKKKCKSTGYIAAYLTTDLLKVPANNQLSLLDDDTFL